MLKHVLATIERGAVGNHALAINDALREGGYNVETYAETIRPEFENTWKNMTELVNDLSVTDTVFYQFANPSPIADVLYDSQCELILNYHNVTPAHFFSRWSPSTSAAVSRARAQLARLAPITSRAIAVSDYNAAELVELGFKNVDVIAPVFSELFFNEEGSTSQPDHSSWLYVGRIAPHKNLHVLLRAFELYRTYVDENAELTIVGSTDTPLYGKAIDELIKARDLGNSVRVISQAPIEELVNAYRGASVFVSASEHEGFCVPIVEAMAMNIPVVVVNAAAVPEACSSAGVLVEKADPELIVDAVARIEKDPELRTRLIDRGAVRSQRFHPRQSATRYVHYLGQYA